MKADKPRGRRWWLWPFGFALLAVVVLSLLRWLVQPERLGRLLLAEAERSSGLKLAVDGPPRLGIWPSLHLQLSGLEVSDPELPGAALASAEQVALYLPLSALRGAPRIEAIALQAPHIDLRGLVRRSAMQMGPPGPPWLPPVRRLDIHDGRIVADGWSLSGVELGMRNLLHDDALSLKASAELLAAGTDSWPLRLQLSADNPSVGQPLAWPLRSLQLGDGDQVFVRADGGQLGLPEWSTPTLWLSGALAGWPPAWPALPEPLRALLPDLDVELWLDPRDPDAALRIDARAEDRHSRIALQPALLVDWLAAGDWLVPPPVSVDVSIQRLEVDGVLIEGLKLEHGSDAER